MWSPHGDHQKEVIWLYLHKVYITPVLIRDLVTYRFDPGERTRVGLGGPARHRLIHFTQDTLRTHEFSRSVVHAVYVHLATLTANIKVNHKINKNLSCIYLGLEER